MSQIIRLPQDMYKRLESHAQGFDTPVNVIERLLNFYETGEELIEPVEEEIRHKESSKLDIIFIPSNIDEFKQQLLLKKVAWILIEKVDGSKEIKEWTAANITADSNIKGNLRSGQLRGWKQKGIVQAIISTDKEML